MKKKIISSILFLLILPCILFISGCKKKEYVAELVDVTFEFISTDYVMTNKTITLTYGDKVEVSAEDFKVIAFYSDGTNKVLSNGDSGYNFSSTIPNDNITPSGSYNIKISYSEFEENFTIIVTKDVVDMSGIDWNYNSAFTYDGTQKSVAIVGLPNGVNVTYSGAEATDAGTYTAIASFTYENAENFQPIPNKTLIWTITPAAFEVVGTAKLKDEFKDIEYKGSNYTIELDLTEFDDNNVRATIDESTITAKNVGTYYARVNLEYIGVSDNYNRLNKTFVTVEWEIEKASLTITAKDMTITYGDAAANDGVIYEGFVGGEDENVLGGLLTFDYGYSVGDNADEYTITPKGLTAENYQITLISGKLKVEQAEIDFAGVDWVKESAYTYTGSEINPVLNRSSDDNVNITCFYAPVGGGTDKPINVGIYVAHALIELKNNNYKIINNNIEDFTYQIIAQKVNVSSLTWNTSSSVEFTDKEILPEINNMPNTLTIVKYSYTKGEEEVEPVNVGTYVASATLKTISANYEIEGTFEDLIYTITSKQVDCSSLAWTTTTEYTYSGNAVKPELIELPKGVEAVYNYTTNAEVPVVVENPTNAGSYLAYVTIRAINNNYEIANYTQLDSLSFVIIKVEDDDNQDGGETENPETPSEDMVIMSFEYDFQEYSLYANGESSIEYDEINEYYFVVVGSSDDVEVGALIEISNLFIYESSTIVDINSQDSEVIELSEGKLDFIELIVDIDQENNQKFAGVEIDGEKSLRFYFVQADA